MFRSLASLWLSYKTVILIGAIVLIGLILGSEQVISQPQVSLHTLLKTENSAVEVKFPPENANLTCDSLMVVGQDINNQADSFELYIDGQSFSQTKGAGRFSAELTDIKKLTKGSHTLLIKALKNGQAIGESSPRLLTKPTGTGLLSCASLQLSS